MEENQLAGQSEMASVWCPKCKVRVPMWDPLLHVSFSPQAWELFPDGRLETGQDVFADYDHLECGTSVRLVCNAGWTEELGEYIHSEAWLEITIDGQEVQPSEDSGLIAFSGSVSEDTETWGSTYVTILEAYKKAVRLLEEKLGGEE